ncbi:MULTISPECIES: hypothetical protein [unclassified Streptomyces]|uniref:hypothetical protein n=1 Tax=unclassified Streptomyces TaxID=2593676 RepID=UPI000A7021B3|nr:MULTISPECIES: hypothetical protein [unclassified Streptomyces]
MPHYESTTVTVANEQYDCAVYIDEEPTTATAQTFVGQAHFPGPPHAAGTLIFHSGDDADAVMHALTSLGGGVQGLLDTGEGSAWNFHALGPGAQQGSMLRVRFTPARA